MTEKVPYPPARDRRRRDRPSGFTRLADYTIPELRKAMITTTLLGVVLGLLLYMSHEVIVAIISGAVLVIVPLAVILSYSWVEISGAAEYLDENRETVAAEIDAGIRRLPFGDRLQLRLVTGVYTFGLVGIVIKPILIGTLQAAFETVTEASAEGLAGSEAP